MTPPSFHSVEWKVPHRISGFFQIMDQKGKNPLDSPEDIGSRGGGPALSSFGVTRIEKLHINTDFPFQIIINGQDQTPEAKTTRTVIEQMQSMIKEPLQIKITHTFDLPLGCGFGTSGAGALGVALGLNTLFNLGLSIQEASKYAHNAEVINRTGLGTVGGQLIGGLSITTRPGYPFSMEQIPYPRWLRIVVGSFGDISTKAILTDPVYRERIIRVGADCMDMITKNFDFRTYMNVCKYFIQKTELVKLLHLDDVAHLIQDLERLDIIGASMNQLGKSVFCMCHESQVQTVQTVFQQYNPSKTLQVLEICPHGPILSNLE